MTTMQTPTADAIAKAADAAGRKIAPLWPLSSFVAVNPFLGLMEQPFDAAMAEVAQTAGAKMTLDPADYVAAIEAGRITADDLDAAARAMPQVAVSGAALAERARRAQAQAPQAWPTMAHLAAQATRRDWPGVITTQAAAICAAQFDGGQAAWKTAHPDGLWAAFSADAAADQSLAAQGLSGASAVFAGLPADRDDAMALLVARLGLSTDVMAAYFTRLLSTLPGWAGHARYRLWQAELAGGTDAALADLLAILLAHEVAVLPLVPAVAQAKAKASYAKGVPQATADMHLLMALQMAYEFGWQRQTFAQLGQPVAAAAAKRPPLQAAFCIDVRSEVFRRALETALPGAETIGFAGFFGAALSYQPLGAATATARCPVLLSPAGTAHDHGPKGLAETRATRIAAKSVWGMFKRTAVAGFGYVETMGLSYAPKLAANSLRMSTALGQGNAGLSAAEARGIAPSLDVIAPGDRVATAATILKAMSMTGPFARVVLLAGHGGQSLNNPHNAGLDCGACGGHSGEMNARLVAMLLNDPQVRDGLPGQGIDVPGDTVFVAALHDTTTDDVRLFDLGDAAQSHAADLTVIRAALARAGALARTERSALLHLEPGAPLADAVRGRARDWSQVRPEWALAGCAAFIAAPRGRTAGVDLGGRAFLHSYDWQADAKNGYPVLELILTAPLVVASWINLQYYGSSVDPKVYGAGNKVLHNVTGLIGVMEGTDGDLKPGLPLQSVHDGERLIHEPLRLHAVVEAPTEAMGAIIAKHDGLRSLLDNGWVHLFQMDGDGQVAHQYGCGGDWEAVARPEVKRAAA